MAKTNYNYEKRAKELEKQKKKEEKRKKKLALKEPDTQEENSSVISEDTDSNS
ncbi:MAG: hypothetical protein WA945_07705 [Arcobacteraceae bacterium]